MRRHLTYANVVATIALVLVVGGGGAYAASKLKLKNNSVTTPKIRDGAVTSPKIADKAVTGAKVAESTLGKVPLAAAADSAGTVGGVALEPVSVAQQEADPFVPQILLSVDGDTVDVGCESIGAHVQVEVNRGLSGPPVLYESFRAGLPDTLQTQAPGSGIGQGTTTGVFTAVIRESSGRVSRLHIEGFYEPNAFGGTADCFFQGTIQRFG